MSLASSPAARDAHLMPTPVVIAAAALMIFAIVIAGVGRLTRFGRTLCPASAPY